MTLRVTTRTPGNTPTYASRAFGYMGLAMYETTVHGIPDHQSLTRQLRGLRQFPLPKTDSVYSWPLALNAGQSHLLKNLYEHTASANKTGVDSLETAIRRTYGDTLKPAVVARSVAFGGVWAGGGGCALPVVGGRWRSSGLQGPVPDKLSVGYLTGFLGAAVRWAGCHSPGIASALGWQPHVRTS